MAYVFESKFFGEKPIKWLLDAANDNPSHITPGPSGDHVSQIQAALFAIDSAAIDAAELGKSLYGPFTAKAVAAFKTKRKILNYLNQIDDIVGHGARNCRPARLRFGEGNGFDHPETLRPVRRSMFHNGQPICGHHGLGRVAGVCVARTDMLFGAGWLFSV
jgi:hypothetical protein